jgi:hypothetical protein
MSIPGLLAKEKEQPDKERYGDNSAEASTKANADFGP